MTLGDRLKYARDRLGLKLTQVAKLVKIGVSSLSDFENNKRFPNMRQLQSLAELYQRSISFFFAEEDIPNELVLWRKKPSHPKAEEIEAKFLNLCKQYHNLEVWCGEELPCRLPCGEFDLNRFDYPDVQKIACDVRKQLCLGDYPAFGLLSVLEERCGIKVFHLVFEPSGCAACTVNDSFGMAILLNKNNVRWRRNFDLAHELFHLLTWNVFRKDKKNKFATPTEKEEKFANCFASNLLIPLEPAKNAFDSQLHNNTLTFTALNDIARQFEVSVEALLWRLCDLFRLNREEIKEAVGRWNTIRTFYEKRQVERHDEPDKRPERFFALALKALHKGEISVGRFAEYLEISRLEAQHYVANEQDKDEEIKVTPT